MDNQEDGAVNKEIVAEVTNLYPYIDTNDASAAFQKIVDVLAIIYYAAEDRPETIQKLLVAPGHALAVRFAERAKAEGRSFAYFQKERLAEIAQQRRLSEFYKFCLAHFSGVLAVDILETLSRDNGRAGLATQTGPALGTLMLKLAAIKPQDRILDPMIGWGSTYTGLIQENADQPLIGQENDPRLADLTQIKFALLGARQTRILLGDTLTAPQFLDAKQPPDVVLMDPILNAAATPQEFDRLKQDPYHRFNLGLPPRTRPDWAYILTAVAAGGRRTIVTAGNASLFVTNKAIVRIRESLLLADMIDTVISLPAGQLTYSNIPVSLIIFKKPATKRANTVRLINATGYSFTQGQSGPLSPAAIANIVAAYQAKKPITGLSVDKSVAELRNNGANLYPDEYVRDDTIQLRSGAVIQVDEKALKARHTTPLQSIATVDRGYNTGASEETADGAYGYVKLSDIVGNHIDYAHLDRGNVNPNTQVTNYTLQQGDIILSIRGANTPPFYIQDPVPEKILLTQNLVRIRPIPGQVDGRWLYRYLLSPLGEAQIAGTTLGSSIALIPIKGLKELSVVLDIPLAEQQSLVAQNDKERQAILAQINTLKQQLNDLDDVLYQKSGINQLYKRLH